MAMNEKLVERRKQLKLTHEGAAQKAGISRAYYTNIEAGRKNPSMKVAKQIADAFKTTVDKLFFSDDVPVRNRNTA